MADISAWSPVDESNTAAPPAGWPEGMPHSAVNNSARAMMGAIRRWYDTITAQVASLTTSLGNYLPLSGGSLWGPLSVNGNLFVVGHAYATNITASADIAATGGTAYLGEVQIAGAVDATGELSSDTSVNTIFYRLRGATFATAAEDLSSVQIGDGTAINLSLYGTGTNYYDNNSHYFRNRGGFSTYAIFAPTGTYNESGTWGTISDRTYKSDVHAYDRGLDALQSLSPVSFRYSGGPFRSERFHYGLIAQDIEAHIPEMVETVDIDGVSTLTMQPSHAIWLLINSCKELAARVEALEQRVL
jgi:hypothetical protein